MCLSLGKHGLPSRLGIETTGEEEQKVPDRKILPGLLFEWFDPAQRQALREIELFQDQAIESERRPA